MRQIGGQKEESRKEMKGGGRKEGTKGGAER